MLRTARMRLRALLASSVLFAFAFASLAQSQELPAPQPQVGQLGKDVVWVPTPYRLIDRMLQMADTGSSDVVVDLGSGDGRIPIVAAKKFGARSLGIEFDADLVQLSLRAAEREGVTGRARFLRQDLFQTDLAQASVIALYVSPAIMLRLRPRLLGLKPGTRIVSHQFTLNEWEADEEAVVERVRAYLWVVPAKADGIWRLQLGEDIYKLELQQTYQMLHGSAEYGGKRATVLAARLRGEEVRFTFLDHNGDSRSFIGRIAGEAMQGTSNTYGRAALPWQAQRISR